MTKSSAKKIVVIRSGALGDCVISIPMFRLLREAFPAAEVTVIGDPYSAPVFEHNPDIDRLLPLAHHNRKFAYLRQLFALRQERFDLLLDCQSCGRSRVQTVIIRAKRRIGFDKGHALANFPYTDLVPYNRSVHAVKRIMMLAENAGAEPLREEIPLKLYVQDEHRRKVNSILASHGVEGKIALLQVTTGQRPPNRIWPTQSFAVVAEHLADRGFTPLVSSHGCPPAIETLVRDSRVPIAALPGMPEPLLLAALIERADIYVGYNTGPMHVAAAVGTPIVALFDVPTDDIEWRPWGTGVQRILRATESPEEKDWHIANISPREVCEAIDEVAPHYAAAAKQR